MVEGIVVEGLLVEGIAAGATVPSAAPTASATTAAAAPEPAAAVGGTADADSESAGLAPNTAAARTRGVEEGGTAVVGVGVNHEWVDEPAMPPGPSVLRCSATERDATAGGTVT